MLSQSRGAAGPLEGARTQDPVTTCISSLSPPCPSPVFHFSYQDPASSAHCSCGEMKHGHLQLPKFMSFSCSIWRLPSCLLPVPESAGKELWLTQLGTAMARVAGGEDPVLGGTGVPCRQSCLFLSLSQERQGRAMGRGDSGFPANCHGSRGVHVPPSPHGDCTTGTTERPRKGCSPPEFGFRRTKYLTGFLGPVGPWIGFRSSQRPWNCEQKCDIFMLKHIFWKDRLLLFSV